MTNRAYILLGSNLNHPTHQLTLACGHIQALAGDVWRKSALYATAAWGKTDQPDFVNQVLVVNTALPAEKLMEVLLAIEQKMGRSRNAKYEARKIDIDLLFYNQLHWKSPLLTLPHPLIQERRFVLVPLNELSPGLKHPLLKKTIHQLLTDCKDPLAVKKI